MQQDTDTQRGIVEAGVGGRRWIERHDWVIEKTSAAPPEAVYDVLADLESHLEWSGRLLGGGAERLLTIEAPAGPAVVGTEFRSTGFTPIGTFVDQSRVVVAERPTRFEFVTESGLEWPGRVPMHSIWVHRFVIEPSANGSRIVRTDRQTGFYTPAPWWVRLSASPPVAVIGYRLMAESTSRATLANLARLAEDRFIRRAASPPAAGPESRGPVPHGSVHPS